MSSPAESGYRNKNIRELRYKSSHIGGQASFENSFNKPGTNSDVLEKLYFKGAEGSPAKRINAGKNYSSIERVYGLDGHMGLQGGSAMQRSASGGGKSHFPINNHGNLIAGGYADVPVTEREAAMYKPYTKLKDRSVCVRPKK